MRYNAYLTESGYRNIKEIVRPFVAKEDGKLPEAEIYFHQDLDGVASALEMREYLKEYGITTVDSHVIQYGGREFYAKAPTDGRLHALVDFGHDKLEFHIWTDHHLHDEKETIDKIKQKYNYSQDMEDDQRKKMEDEISKINKSRGDIRHAKSNAEIINGFFSSNRGFTSEDMKIISMVDSAGFAKYNIEPSQVAKTIFKLEKQKDTKELSQEMRLAAAESLLAYKNKKGYLTGFISGENAVAPSLLAIYNYTKNWISRTNEDMRGLFKTERDTTVDNVNTTKEEMEDLYYLDRFDGDYQNIPQENLDSYKDRYNTSNPRLVHLYLSFKYSLSKSQQNNFKLLLDKMITSNVDPSTIMVSVKNKQKPVFNKIDIDILNFLQSKFNKFLSMTEGQSVKFTPDDAKALSKLLQALKKEIHRDDVTGAYDSGAKDIVKANTLYKLKMLYLQRDLSDIEKNKMDYGFETMFSSNVKQKENVVFSTGLAEMQGNKQAVTYGGYNRYAIFRTNRNSSYGIVEWGMGLLQISCNPWKDKSNPINLYNLTSEAIENNMSDLINIKISLGTLKKRKEKNPKEKLGLDKILGFTAYDIEKLLDAGLIINGKEEFVHDPDIKNEIKKALNSNRYTMLLDSEKQTLAKYYITAYHWIRENSGGHINISNIAGLDIIEEYIPLTVPNVTVKPEKKYIPSFEQRKREELENQYSNGWTTEQKRADLNNSKNVAETESSTEQLKTYFRDMVKNIQDYNYEKNQIVKWIVDNESELIGGQDKLAQQIIYMGKFAENGNNKAIDTWPGKNDLTTVGGIIDELENLQKNGHDLDNWRILIVSPRTLTVKIWKSHLNFGRGKLETLDSIENIMIRKVATNGYSMRSTDLKRKISNNIKSFLFNKVKNTDLISERSRTENEEKMLEDKTYHLSLLYHRIQELKKQIEEDTNEIPMEDDFPVTEIKGIETPHMKLTKFEKIYTRQINSLRKLDKESRSAILNILQKTDKKLHDLIVSILNENYYGIKTGVLQ